MRVQNTNAGDVFGAAGCSGKPVTPGGLKAAAGARRIVLSSTMLRAMSVGGMGSRLLRVAGVGDLLLNIQPGWAFLTLPLHCLETTQSMLQRKDKLASMDLRPRNTSTH